MDCPYNYDCFGCVDKATGFCPLENNEDEEICIHCGNRVDECECEKIAAKWSNTDKQN